MCRLQHQIHPIIVRSLRWHAYNHLNLFDINAFCLRRSHANTHRKESCVNSRNYIKIPYAFMYNMNITNAMPNDDSISNNKRNRAHIVNAVWKIECFPTVIWNEKKKIAAGLCHRMVVRVGVFRATTIITITKILLSIIIARRSCRHCPSTSPQ